MFPWKIASVLCLFTFVYSQRQKTETKIKIKTDLSEHNERLTMPYIAQVLATNEPSLCSHLCHKKTDAMTNVRKFNFRNSRCDCFIVSGGLNLTDATECENNEIVYLVDR